MPKPNTPKLTKKQEAFARACIGGTASDAYRAAYATKGMTAKTVNEEASRLLANPKISARVAELAAPGLKKAAMDAEETILEIARVAAMTPEEAPKYSDKLNALSILAKHHGLFEKDNKQRTEGLSLEVVLVGVKQ